MNREEKKQKTHLAIYVAAMELFREIGYEKATVEKIAERAGVAKGSFFNYFKTKDDVLRHASDLQIERVEELVFIKMEQDGPVHLLIKELFSDLVSRVEWTRNLIFTMFQSTFSNPYNRDSYIKKFSQVIRPLIERGQKNGELSDRYSADLLSKMTVQTYFAAEFNWSSEESNRTLVEEIALTMDLFFEGATSKK